MTNTCHEDDFSLCRNRLCLQPCLILMCNSSLFRLQDVISIAPIVEDSTPKVNRLVNVNDFIYIFILKRLVYISIFFFAFLF